MIKMFNVALPVPYRAEKPSAPPSAEIFTIPMPDRFIIAGISTVTGHPILHYLGDADTSARSPKTFVRFCGSALPNELKLDLQRLEVIGLWPDPAWGDIYCFAIVTPDRERETDAEEHSNKSNEIKFLYDVPYDNFGSW